jgi:hypothetical protein
MLVTSVSFFNEVATETQKLSSNLVSFFNEVSTNAKNYQKPCSLKPLFHFLTRLPQRRKNYPRKSRFNPQTSVSFFNEVAAETQKLSSKPLFHFLTRLPQRRKNYPRKTLFLIMDSKRTMLWNDTMSRDKTQSWLPRGLHWKEETHSGRTPCRESR